MNKELQEYYDSLFDLFGSKGWKVLTQQLEANKSSISFIRDIPDAKNLHFKQGQLDVIDIILTLPALTEQSFKSAQEPSE
jgi:hypothetical protein